MKKRPSPFTTLPLLLALLTMLGLGGCGDDDDNDGDGVIDLDAQADLDEWRGDWVSHAVYLDGEQAQAGYASMALEKPGYSAADIEPVVKSAYATDFGRLVIEDDRVTFYDHDRRTATATCDYVDQGAGTMSGEPARKFVLKAGAPESCERYHDLLLQPLMHHDSGEEHLHIRYADAAAGGFEALMEGEDQAGWWPILTRSDTTTETYVVDYMLEFTDFYVSLLPAVGTVVFLANGEDFVREGFVSEDGWRIDFTAVHVNLTAPAVYQTGAEAMTILHAGHGDDAEPGAAEEVFNRAVLSGDYFLALKQPTFEVGRHVKAAPGTYRYLEFTVTPATSDSQGFQAAYAGDSIVLAGRAVKETQTETQTVDFTIAFNEIMRFVDCGPMDAALTVDGEIRAETTFHFDHLFGDKEEGPADPADTDTVNYLAVGFQPFADLSANGVLDIRQADMLTAGMPEAVYTQLMDAVHTLGHTGEAHCDVIPAAARRYLTNHGIFALQAGDSFADPRNPKRIVMHTTAQANTPTIMSFYTDLAGATSLAIGCAYQYAGSRPDPYYFPRYKTSVWDLFRLEADQAQTCQAFAQIAVRSPHDSPPHMHFRYGDASTDFDTLLDMSHDPKAGFDPWWSEYQAISSDTPPAKNHGFLNVNGRLVADAATQADPRNPEQIDMLTTAEPDATTRLSFSVHGNPDQVWATGDYQYVGSEPDPQAFPDDKTAVWDLFELQQGIAGDIAGDNTGDIAGDQEAFHYVMFRVPHDSPVHAHLRYGGYGMTGFDELLGMSHDPAVGFDPWWSNYIQPSISPR